MPVTVVAPAKLTVSFKLLGRRHDGYHLVDGELVALDHADVLTIDPDGDGLAVTGPAAAGVPADGSNLVAKALALVGRSAHVTIDKHIRPEGGLGGGSSDAAAVLRWAGVADPAVAARLGADVAFCLVGGRARVTGVGEHVEPLAFEARTYTLVTPPFGVSTVAAYRAWDDLGGPVVEGPNDLEPAAFAVEPRLVVWRDRIREAAGRPPVLAGSGSTFFVAGAVPGLAEALPEAAVVVAATVPAP